MANFDKVILNGTTYTIPSGGGGTTYTAGEGIDITNDVISADTDEQNKVIASALTELHNDKADKNQLNNYQLKGNYVEQSAVDASIEAAVANYRTEAEAINVEKVDAAALNDLDARVETLEQGGGGSGITGITMNGSPVTVTSGVANLGNVVTDKSDKQDTLVSGTNIKTINNESILGSGNIEIQGGSDINVVQTTGTSTTDVMSQNAVTSNFISDIRLNYMYNGRDTLILHNPTYSKMLPIPYMTINGKKVLSINDLSVVETSAITTSVTSSSTDSQVPSAKAVYDALQEGGGGTTYTAGDGIDITNDVISNTREQRVLRYDDTITGVKAALQVVSPHWDYSNETVSDPANGLTFINNVPVANADPYVQRDYITPDNMEFEIIDYSADSSSSFEFDTSEVGGGDMLYYYDGEWNDAVDEGIVLSPSVLRVGLKIRMNNIMFSAFVSAMQADCPYEDMEVQYKTYAWNTNKSVSGVHSGTAYQLAYNSDLTALAARVTALETALGNINTLLAAI